MISKKPGSALHRRSFMQAGLAGLAATTIPFSEWFASRARAQTVMTRYSAFSDEGQTMLGIYGDAVAAMRAKNDGDPLSWTFQWYTHWVRGDSTKSAQIQSIYGGNPSYNKTLALSNWDTCRGHGGFQAEWFLPWHRMFVFYFEEIIREVTGKPEFTLPYWPYDQVQYRVIPPEFRDSGSALFMPNRREGINKGEQIDTLPGTTPLDFSCLGIPTYMSSPGNPQGFNDSLDANPHGAVHDDVGDNTNMGAIPWAANDPIFWLHHCQVDRLWASWNQKFDNPSSEEFTDLTFTFADAQGQLVVGTTGDFLATEPLGYDYETLVPLPDTTRPILTLSSSLPVGGTVLFGAGAAPRTGGAGARLLGTDADSGAPIALGGTPTRVALEPAVGVEAGLLSRMNRLSAAAQRTFLVLENISAEAPPTTGYLVFVNLAEGEETSPQSPAFVGSINFFNAVRMPGMDMKMTDSFVFDITGTLRSLAEAGRSDDAPVVSIVPTGPLDEGANPEVGSIRIFTQ
ncbi:MAG: tyrosinase family protein [Alphaproteobacteria bacterium]|nr:tyrosinase family protein [Alphaproteobacteria bacterium]